MHAASGRSIFVSLPFGLIFFVCMILVLGCDDKSEKADSQIDSEIKEPDAAPPAAKEVHTTSKADTTSESAEPAENHNRATKVHATTGPKNHLANETSLYLRMHVRNPVDWYPWGEEAFAKAKKEGKLIFLSVGYSSCYWCHVMERESFEDEEIAKFLNEHFVCIKVDREERPDVDSIYMTSVQIRTGRGGWPMSVFMTADAKPFFGGTYFPARDDDRPGSRGFLSIVKMIHQVWKDQPENVIKDADTITGLVKQQLRAQTLPQEPTQAIIDSVRQSLSSTFDATYGGFGYDAADPRRPKFPEPSNLMFLVDASKRTDDENVKKMLVTTLDRMSMGGIWDHVGGGFHRYSTDRFWKIPHFEKMLYDNGQLLSVYADAYEITKRDDYRRVVEQTVAYMNRELRASDGAYFAAMDAESEQVEGKFYRWKADEIKELLGDQFKLFAEIYGIDGQPNFEHEFYVPQLSRPFSEFVEQRQTTDSELEKRLQPLRDTLLAARNKRPRPLTDNKIITSWNGLAIRGLADAGRVLNNPEITNSAAQAAMFILSNLRTPEGRLHRTFTDGKASLNAYLDDYAFLVDGLIALHKATNDDKWLMHATELTEKQIELFWDEEDGAFFFTSSDHEALIARSQSFIDSVRPSGNSVSVENLMYLAAKANRADYQEKAQTTMKAAAGLVEQSAGVATRMSISFHTMIK